MARIMARLDALSESRRDALSESRRDAALCESRREGTGRAVGRARGLLATALAHPGHFFYHFFFTRTATF